MINKDMIIDDVLKQVPAAIKVFLDQGIHCVGCGAALHETVEQGARAHGVDPAILVDEINKLAKQAAN